MFLILIHTLSKIIVSSWRNGQSAGQQNGSEWVRNQTNTSVIAVFLQGHLWHVIKQENWNLDANLIPSQLFGYNLG